MNTEADWKKALKLSPDDKTLLLAYGDWLEEQGDMLHACQAREKAGRGKVTYSVWHPSWGNERFGEYRKLAHLKAHLRTFEWIGKYQRNYKDQLVPLKELVVVIEWHELPQEIARHPYTPNLRV